MLKTLWGFLVILLFLSCWGINKRKQDYPIKLYPSIEDSTLFSSASFAEKLSTTLFDSFAKRHHIDSYFIAKFIHNPEQYYHRGENEPKTGFGSQYFQSDYPDNYDLKGGREADAETIFFLGRKKDSSFFLIVDSDNDNDFQNEKIYPIQNSKNVVKYTTPTIQISNLKSRYGDTIITSTAKLKVAFYKPDEDLRYAGLDGINLNIILNEYRTGSFKLRGRKYKAAARNLSPKLMYDSNSFLMFSLKKKDFIYKTTRDPGLVNHLGDTIKLGRKYFTIKSITPFGESVTLHPLDKDFHQTDKLVNFSFRDFLSGDEFSSVQLLKDKKYLLIDFWGSWCRPCIEAFADVKKYYTEIENQVEFLGVIYDDTLNFDKIKSHLKNYGVNWKQFFIDKQLEQNSLVTKLRIMLYPSYILVDRSGRIVYRDFGIEGFERLKAFIAKREKKYSNSK